MRGTGVTTCTVAAGLMCSYLQGSRITLFDNHLTRTDTANVLFENKWDYYLKNARNRAALLGKYCGYELLERQTCKSIDSKGGMEIIKDHLWLNCDASLSYQNCFEEDFIGLLDDFCERESNEPGYAFFDTEESRNRTSYEILNRAELAVVILPASIGRIHFFFENYSSLVGKSVFILNKYNSQNNYLRDRLCSSYGIAKDRVFVLSYCSGLERASEEGRVPDFLINNLNCKKGGENYAFMQTMHELANYIVGENIENRKKEAYEKTKKETCVETGACGCGSGSFGRSGGNGL